MLWRIRLGYPETGCQSGVSIYCWNPGPQFTGEMNFLDTLHTPPHNLVSQYRGWQYDLFLSFPRKLRVFQFLRGARDLKSHCYLIMNIHFQRPQRQQNQLQGTAAEIALSRRHECAESLQQTTLWPFNEDYIFSWLWLKGKGRPMNNHSPLSMCLHSLFMEDNSYTR